MDSRDLPGGGRAEAFGAALVLASFLHPVTGRGSLLAAEIMECKDAAGSIRLTNRSCRPGEKMVGRIELKEDPPEETAADIPAPSDADPRSAMAGPLLPKAPAAKIPPSPAHAQPPPAPAGSQAEWAGVRPGQVGVDPSRVGLDPALAGTPGGFKVPPKFRRVVRDQPPAAAGAAAAKQAPAATGQPKSLAIQAGAKSAAPKTARPVPVHPRRIPVSPVGPATLVGQPPPSSDPIIGESPWHEVVVYGRSTCGNTQRMKEDLARSGIPFRYADLDSPAGLAEVRGRMRQNGRSGGFELPVVSIGGAVHVSPPPQRIVSAYQCYGQYPCPDPGRSLRHYPP